MANKTYSGSINLTKLKHVKLEMNGKPNEDGTLRKVQGIFIPFEVNKLVVLDKQVDGKTERSIFMPTRIIVKSEQDANGQNGFIAKSLSTEDYKLLKTDEEKKAAQEELMPILGSIKDFSGGGGDQAATGSVSDNTFTPSDEVPF